MESPRVSWQYLFHSFHRCMQYLVSSTVLLGHCVFLLRSLERWMSGNGLKGAGLVWLVEVVFPTCSGFVIVVISHRTCWPLAGGGQYHLQCRLATTPRVCHSKKFCTRALWTRGGRTRLTFVNKLPQVITNNDFEYCLIKAALAISKTGPSLKPWFEKWGPSRWEPRTLPAKIQQSSSDDPRLSISQRSTCPTSSGFERGNVIDLCNGIMFDFYPGLPHTHMYF